jgi:hypothetical protein
MQTITNQGLPSLGVIVDDKTDSMYVLMTTNHIELMLSFINSHLLMFAFEFLLKVR